MATGYLLIALAAIDSTLLVSWQLEGGAAAINHLGSERMRAWRIALLVSQPSATATDRAEVKKEARREIEAFSRTLAELQTGNPARPLFLPRGAEIHKQFVAVQSEWRSRMRPNAQRLLQIADGPAIVEYGTHTEAFVQQIDRLVLAVEHELSGGKALLRSLQFGLIALSVVGTVGLIGLMFLLVVRPVLRLQ